jgi:hypothetical protein
MSLTNVWQGVFKTLQLVAFFVLLLPQDIYLCAKTVYTILLTEETKTSELHLFPANRGCLSCTVKFTFLSMNVITVSKQKCKI